MKKSILALLLAVLTGLTAYGGNAGSPAPEPLAGARSLKREGALKKE